MSKGKKIRPGVDRGWFAVPASLVLSNVMSLRDFKLLLLLMERENYFNEEKFYCSVNWMSKVTGYSERWVRQSIKWLVDYNYILLTKERGCNKYTINWEYINSLEEYRQNPGEPLELPESFSFDTPENTYLEPAYLEEIISAHCSGGDL